MRRLLILALFLSIIVVPYLCTPTGNYGAFRLEPPAAPDWPHLRDISNDPPDPFS